MSQIRKYGSNNFAKFAKELFNKNYRSKLSLHAQKLLYGLASSIDENETLFPEWHFHIEGLFKYMNIENTNNRYEIIREAVSEIAHNPLQYRRGKKWGFLSWFSKAEFDPDKSKYVAICFGPDVKPILLQLKEYCRLEMKYFVKLSGSYSMWLYPYLRNIANQKKSFLEMTLQEIKELTYNEKTVAYDPKKSQDANKDLLKRIIGIEKKRGTEYYAPLQTKRKDGTFKESGAIFEINTKTDLMVNCDVIKEGRSIKSVRFNVQFKPETYQGKRKAIRNAHRTDYKKNGARQLKIEEIKAGKIEDRIDMTTIEAVAESSGRPVEDVLRENGYFRSGDEAVKL